MAVMSWAIAAWAILPREFVWTTASGMRDLGNLPGLNPASLGQSIDDHGQVVGGSQGKPFLWNQESGMIDLGLLPGSGSSDALAINASGQIVGTGQFGVGLLAFLWTPDDGLRGPGHLPGDEYVTIANDINDSGQVVGVSRTGAGFRVSVDRARRHDRSRNSTGTPQHGADGINSIGEIVGSSQDDGGDRAFHWSSDNGMRNIGDLPGGDDVADAFDINDRSEIVGWSGTPTGRHGFIWTKDGGMLDLNVMLDHSGAGWTIRQPTAINNAGQIVGNGYNPDGFSHGFLLTPIPDPPVLGFSQFNEPPLGAGTFNPSPTHEEIGFATTTSPSGGVNPLAGVADLGARLARAALTHRSINAATTFQTIDLANYDDAFMSLRVQVTDTGYDSTDFVRVYVTNGTETLDLLNLSDTTGLHLLDGIGFVRYWAAIPNDWTQAALVISSSSNSSDGAKRYDFDSIEFRGGGIPEPPTWGFILGSLVAAACEAETPWSRSARRPACG